MTKRYVFWRDDKGVPYRRDYTKHAPEELLKTILNSASLTDQGALKTDMTFLHYWFALESAVAIVVQDDVQLNRKDIERIVERTIRRYLEDKGYSVSPKDFLELADEETATYLRQDDKTYILVTTLSLQSFPKRRIRVRNCEISPLKHREPRYPYPDTPMVASPRFKISEHIKNTDYQQIRAKVSGKTSHDAVQKALCSINLLRAYWNLFLTLGKNQLSLGPFKTKPFQIIRTGPVYTIHYSTGELVENTLWYDPDFSEEHRTVTPPKGWDNLEDNRQWAVRQVNQLPYREDLQDLMIQYASALDEENNELAFLRMWALLENITATVGDSYEKTINRAVWIFRDRKIAKELLHVLRFRRNMLVHKFQSGDDARDCAHHVKFVLDRHLLRLIRNDFDVTSIQEYGECLSLPTSIDRIKQMQKRFDIAMKIHNQSSK